MTFNYSFLPRLKVCSYKQLQLSEIGILGHEQEIHLEVFGFICFTGVALRLKSDLWDL